MKVIKCKASLTRVHGTDSAKLVFDSNENGSRYVTVEMDTNELGKMLSGQGGIDCAVTLRGVDINGSNSGD